MDTRYWGPSGWQLLHLITFAYDQSRKESYKQLFSLLEYILPCKYCRQSTEIFIKEIPPTITSAKSTQEWLYKFHNRVNMKLRIQQEAGDISSGSTDAGSPYQDDPSFSEVKKHYMEILNKKPTKMPGLDFLSAIIYNFPIEKSEQTETKKSAYINFFNLLGDVFPFKPIRDSIKSFLEKSPIENHIDSRKSLIKWYYNMLKEVCQSNDIDCISYKSLCMTCAYYKSSCSKKTYRGKTCRTIHKGPSTFRTKVRSKDPSKIYEFVHNRLL
jgi:hypothetical protein